MGAMRHHKTTNGHGKRADNKADRSDAHAGARNEAGAGGQVEHQIQHAQAEERNVRETIETTLETAVAAEPVLTMRVEAKRKTRREAENDPKPGNPKIQLCDLFHNRQRRHTPCAIWS